MIRGEFEDAGEQSPETLRRAYETRLSETVESVGVDRAVDETPLNRDRITALLDGASPDIELTEAAAILALDEDRPHADTIAADARDILLMGMTTAVLDVETLASGIDGQLEPKEIQQKVEGRFPMTVAEYALLHQFIAQREG
ncbi:MULTISPECIES: DUF5791 family protein [Halomicrobium]|uniref:Uncharacterized protein n=2 Tax=Halomicrobium mukohataei TaxID=57705 RepID=C7P1R6_HALMD|nr:MULTISPECIES: DUF5791 family protein [Halomicrobium]ACV49156.1 conserved hypothetical protein [Halomicrobium mukohataei DSM 12286]QCD64565.1 hypothetical protein E5139_02515 [Halomicrobium mukohataei]QFR19372.1 hypothetical protein GBQ70_02515 [Halomicrobium sp. ZPS1]